MGTALVIMIPYLLWDAYRPPAFRMSVHSDRVEYEFRSKEYALEFAQLNVGAGS
jgi:hypothetical protein